MSDDSTRELTPIPAMKPFEELTLSEERRIELAPKLQALLHELVKIRELELLEGEPATPWPWQGSDDGR